MHPELGAHLSGMGDHGVVNLQLTSSSGKLCWTFDVPDVMGATLATIHTGQTGATLLELGMHYTKTGCEKESAMTLEHLETKPGGLLGLGRHQGAHGRAARRAVRRHGAHVGAGPSSASPPKSPRENVGARRVGRAGFLGLVGAGAATLFFGKQISSVTSAVTKPFADATGLSRHRALGRLAHLHGRRDDADLRPARRGGFGSTASCAGRWSSPTDELLALPKAEQVSTFHCVTGWTVDGVHWGGVRFADLLALAQPLPQAHAAHFVSAEVPYDDYLELGATSRCPT